MSDWSTPFVSGSGLCYPSTDYSNVNKLRGGKVNPDGIIKTSFGGSKKSKQRGGQKQSLLSFEGPFPNNMSLLGNSGEKVAGFNPLNSYGMIKTQCAGSKQRSKQRGGQQVLSSFEGPYPDKMLLLGDNSVKVSGFNPLNSYGKVSEQSGGNKKSTKSKQRGGQSLIASEGSYPPLGLLEKSSDISGYSEGTFATYNNSQKGGKKSSTKSKQRGGQSLMASEGPYPPVGLLEKSGDVSGYSEGTFATYNDSQKGGSKKSNRKQRGSGDTEGETALPQRWFTGKGGVRKMKGGMETMGATPMPPSFYDPSIKLNNVPSLEGNRDVGMVDLVPNAPGNTLGNVMKTGGSRNKLTHKNKFKKGGELIPRVNDPSPGIRSTINGAIDSFTDFMQQLDQSYLNSVKYYQSVKIGGKKSSSEKKNKSQEKNKSQKESNKSNSKSKNKKSKKQKGGDGSDFALTLGSRGACNAPDDFWGVDGETWFRQFNKSGDYIPNSQLAYAAAPLLTSDPKNTTVVGFDEMGNDYGIVNF